MRGVLIDLDGVIYLSPGAHTTVAWLRRQGIPHLFLTNTTSKPKAALLAKLAQAAAAILCRPAQPVGEALVIEAG